MARPWCGSNTCVDVATNDDGKTFEFTSTIGADKGRVTYNADEVYDFLVAVKAGKADHLIDLAKARVAEMAPAGKGVDRT